MQNIDPQTIIEKMETTTGAEQDFWYDRYYDLKAEADDQRGAALEAMNGRGPRRA